MRIREFSSVKIAAGLPCLLFIDQTIAQKIIDSAALPPPARVNPQLVNPT